MKPPYQITTPIITLIASIGEKLGAIKATNLQYPRADLRKENRIRTIQASLAIEGNSLTLEMVTALLENKRVRGPEKDILEVKNAIEVYNHLEKLSVTSLNSFLTAHKMMMKGLVPSAGKLRSNAVGIFKGPHMMHMAPPADRVKALMKDLFSYLLQEEEMLLIKSCVFHYEMEFIHPFVDGNGRMGRLWQTLILMQYYPLFAYLPVESVVKANQQDYYKALREADKIGQSTPFIEYMLNAIDQALAEQLNQRQPPLTAEERIVLYKTVAQKERFSRKEYLHHFRSISTATASRDLKLGVTKKILKQKGDKRTAVYSYH